MRLSGLWFLAALAATSARAASSADIWVSQPTREEIRAALPAQARAAGVRVVFRCKANPRGDVTDCAVAGETPGSAGAGAALLPLTAKFRFKPTAVAAAAPQGEATIVASFFNVDTAPDWRRRPTARDLRAVWPAEAFSNGVDGRALINCLVATSGGLYDCMVITDSPPGRGFGGAAVALTPQLLMSPGTLEGRPVVSDIMIPINFTGATGRPADMLLSRTVLPPAVSWTRAPSLSDVAAAYPAQARAAKLGGFASLQCGFGKDGHLRDCSVIREEPRDQGFATAAKALAKLFQLDPAAAPNVRLTEASVTLPVVFDPAAAGASTGGKPVWTHLPDAAALNAAFAAAKPASVAGNAVLACQVGQGGQLEACAVASETPAGAGLGKTALALQTSFRLATWSTEGLPIVGGSTHVPIRFDFSDPSPTPKDTAPPKP